MRIRTSLLGTDEMNIINLAGVAQKTIRTVTDVVPTNYRA